MLVITAADSVMYLVWERGLSDRPQKRLEKYIVLHGMVAMHPLLLIAALALERYLTRHGSIDWLVESYVIIPRVNAIEQKTVPAMYLGPTAAYIISFNVSDNFYRDTIADERFWEIYQKAVEELTDSSEKYVCDEEKNTSRIVEWETFAQLDIEFLSFFMKTTANLVLGMIIS